MDTQTVEFIESWLYGRPKTTQKVYLSSICRAFEWMNVGLSGVTLQDLQDYQAELFHHRRLKTATVAANMRAVCSFLAFAADEGWIPRNPAKNLKVPKVNRRIDDKVLSHDEVNAAISAAKAGRDQTLLKFLYAVGCRVSEACSVTWKDIKPKPDGVAVVDILGKGDKWRSVRIPASVWNEMQALRGDADPLDRVFPISVRWAQEIAKNAGYGAKLHDGLTPHKFRHSNASHAIEAGAPLPVVRDSLGHSSIAVTDIYAHSNPEQSSSDYLGL